MRQAGIIAAAGIYAIDNNLKLIENDHNNAKSFAKNLSAINKISCDIKKVETNIVVFNLDKRVNPELFVSKCKENGLLLSSIGGTAIRVVFHLQITKKMAENAVLIIEELINNIVNG